VPDAEGYVQPVDVGTEYLFRSISASLRNAQKYDVPRQLAFQNSGPEIVPRPDLYGAGYIRPLPRLAFSFRRNNRWAHSLDSSARRAQEHPIGNAPPSSGVLRLVAPHTLRAVLLVGYLSQPNRRNAAPERRSAALANYWALKIPQSHCVCLVAKRFNEKPRLMGASCGAARAVSALARWT
jgi:hypothetical protein